MVLVMLDAICTVLVWRGKYLSWLENLRYLTLNFPNLRISVSSAILENLD